MKVILIDDHALMRKGIRIILEEISGVEVVAEYSSAEDFMDDTSKNIFDFDLLFLDISLTGGMNGLDLLQLLKDQGFDKGVFILSAFSNVHYVKRCAELGVDAYIIKNNSDEEIGRAIDSYRRKGKYFSQEVLDTLVAHQKSVKDTSPDQILLTKRESEVLKEVMNGLSSKEISEKLFISSRTVDTHRFNIMKKFEVKNSAELVRKVIEENII